MPEIVKHECERNTSLLCLFAEPIGCSVKSSDMPARFLPRREYPMRTASKPARKDLTALAGEIQSAASGWRLSFPDLDLTTFEIYIIPTKAHCLVRAQALVKH